MLRLKLIESQLTELFLAGGYISIDKLKHALLLSNEAIPPLFIATPYYDVVEPGVHYFDSNNSFLKIEQHCERHMLGFLKSTMQITAGPQPIIAYLLLKQHEIRTIRFILTSTRNQLENNPVSDENEQIIESANKIIDQKYPLIIVAENVAEKADEVFRPLNNSPAVSILVVPFTTESKGFAIESLGETLKMATGISILQNN